jgi:serine/threonine protein kinase
MAPELFDSKKAKKIGTEVDIWAFGCILIEIFSNQRPWNHISSVNVNCIYYELFNQKPIPIPSCIPKQVQKIIEKCCRYETSERITAAQALEDLIAARDTCIVARKKSM